GQPAVDEVGDAALGRGQDGGAAVVELAQAAVEVAPRDARRGDALPPAQVALARARLDAQRIGVERDPAGAVALRTGGGGEGGHWEHFRAQGTGDGTQVVALPRRVQPREHHLSPVPCALSPRSTYTRRPGHGFESRPLSLRAAGL